MDIAALLLRSLIQLKNALPPEEKIVLGEHNFLD